MFLSSKKMKKLSFWSILFFSIVAFAQETTPLEKTNTEVDLIYNIEGVDIKPEFPGGMAQFYRFIANNFRVPEKKGLNGKIYVTFIVEKDGSLSDIKVLKDVGYGTGSEVYRVLKKCPNWTPGQQNGKIVRVLFSFPITIQSN